jgi:hypothetical protein
MEKASPKLSSEQIALIDRNLELSIDERIIQLQSALELIEEMRNSIQNLNENKF